MRLVGPVTIYRPPPQCNLRKRWRVERSRGRNVRGGRGGREELPAALRGALAADGEALLKELQLPGSHHRAHHHQLRALYPGAAAE